MTTELMLGSVQGIDYVLWAYTFAALIFTGSLSDYLPLAVSIVIVSSAVITLVVALTSTFPVTIAGIEEQAVAILATISILVNAHISEFSSTDAAAATMFLIMGLSAILIGLSFYLSAFFNLSPFIQLMPFPVVCGFLAGTGWLFIAAGITMMTGLEVEVPHLAPLLEADNLVFWLPALACGLVIYVAITVKHYFLTLPAALVACAIGFYGIVLLSGTPFETVQESNWMFHMNVASGTKGLADLDFGGVNFNFILSVLPEIGAIVLISMLTTSFSFSALELGTGKTLDINNEFRAHGTANLISGMGFGLPGLIEVAPSVMFFRMGATSRLLPIFCAFLCLTAAFLGGNFVEYVPKVVMGALVFMAGIQFIHEWLFITSKEMPYDDMFTVWTIFGVIVLFDFIPGILVGIILTSLLFIIRISRIDVVGASLGLDKLSSSVERSIVERWVLKEHGQEVKIFNLSGFLFFGSANAFFERIKTICDQDSKHSYFIFNFERIIGVDSTAAQIFLKLNNLLDSHGIKPVFCGLNDHVLSSQPSHSGRRKMGWRRL